MKDEGRLPQGDIVDNPESATGEQHGILGYQLSELSELNVVMDRNVGH